MASFEDPRQAAKSKVTAPAICMMVGAALGILFSLYLIVNGAITVIMPAKVAAAQAEQLKKMKAQPMNKGMDPETYTAMIAGGGVVNILAGLLEIVVAGVIIFGGIKMMSLKSYGLAMTAAILSLIPCISPCCCATLPFGIWALVVLMDSKVKESFT